LTRGDIRATFLFAVEKMSVQKVKVAPFGTWVALLLLGVGALQAAGPEKIEISGSRPQIEPPKPEKKFDRLPGVSSSGMRDPESPDAVFTPNAPQPSVIFDKEMLRKMDRDRNWMFINPYELDRKASGLDKLEKQNQNRWLEDSQESKSVLEKFFDERSRRSNSEPRSGNDPVDLNRAAEQNPFETARDREDADARRDGEENAFLRELSLKAFLNPAEFERENREQRERPASAGLDWRNIGPRESTLSRKDDLRRQEEARSLEFQKLLQPRSLTPSISGRVDPINSQPDPSRQEWNPIAPSAFGNRNPIASTADRNFNSPAGASGAATRPATEPSAPSDDFRATRFESFGAISLPKTGPAASAVNSPYSFSQPAPRAGAGLTAIEPPRRKF